MGNPSNRPAALKFEMAQQFGFKTNIMELSRTISNNHIKICLPGKQIIRENRFSFLRGWTWQKFWEWVFSEKQMLHCWRDQEPDSTETHKRATSGKGLGVCQSVKRQRDSGRRSGKGITLLFWNEKCPKSIHKPPPDSPPSPRGRAGSAGWARRGLHVRGPAGGPPQVSPPGAGAQDCCYKGKNIHPVNFLVRVVLHALKCAIDLYGYGRLVAISIGSSNSSGALR